MDYQILKFPYTQWSEQQYQRAAALIGISSSSTRRVFLPQRYEHYNFNTRTKEKYVQFLGFSSWEALNDALVANNNG